jgi:hypothetical protein
MNRPDVAAALPPFAKDREPIVVFPLWVWLLYAAQALGSVASNLLLMGIFFYTARALHWGTGRNLTLATVQGVIYTSGALLAQRYVKALGRVRGLAMLNFICGIVPAIAWLYPSPWVIGVVLIVYTGLSALEWPTMESLVSSDSDAVTMSRRIGAYNLVWSGVGVVTIAVCGWLIERMPSGVFFVPVICHALNIVIFCLKPMRLRDDGPVDSAESHHAAPPPEPALVAQRSLAMQLSRVCLPATYTVAYSLMALMPALPVIQSFDLRWQTAVASAWLSARFVAFLLLSASSWWHTRPRALLIAAVIMLMAFLGVTLRPQDMFGPSAAVSPYTEQMVMTVSQMFLGATMGLIYSASLYFGMVLSEGSTEHGGYHEALVGVGQAIGPGAGLAAATWQPGQPRVTVAAIAVVLAISVLAAVGVSVRAAMRR